MYNKTLKMPLLGKFTARAFWFVGLAVIAGMVMLGHAWAEETTGGAISQGFLAGEGGLKAGMLVGSRHDSPNAVELSNTSRLPDIVGVVADKSLVELGNDAGSINVVTSGVTQALVSDINGDVVNGDKITASPINGIGMKVTDPMLIVGTAQADLSSVKTEERTIHDRDGVEQTVKVGFIPVDVRVTFYAATEVQAEFVPPFLQGTANTIAGKPVSPVRVIASLMVVLLALISVMVLLYSSVRSSIISIGRNPLSERAVHRGLIEVGITVVGILSLTFITVYLILVT